MRKKAQTILQKYSYTWPFLIFLLLTVFFTRKFLFQPGLMLYSEFLESTNFWVLLKDFLKGWGEYASFGHSNIGLTTSYGLNPVFWILPPGYFTPILSFLTFLQLLFGQAAGKAYIVLGIIAPFVGMYFFTHYWFRSYAKKAIDIQTYSFIASLVYGISSIMADKIIAAHLRYSYGHALLPLLAATTLLALEQSKKRLAYILASGLQIGILIWLMPHALTLYVFFIGLYYVVVIRNRAQFFPLVTIGFFSFVIGLLLNIHIWLPAIFYSEPLSYIEDPQFLMQFVYHLSNIMPYIDSFLLTSSYDRASLPGITIKYIILGKIVLVSMGLVGFFVKKGRRELFLLLIAVIGILFSIGIKYPFETIFSYLFEHVFLFKPFRDISKFRILYLFSLSLLIPNVFIYIKEKYKRFFWPLLICFTLALISIHPAFYSGNFLGSIRPYNIPEKYDKLNTYLSSQKDDFRIAVYPNNTTIMDYEWYQEVKINTLFNSVFLSVVPLSKDLAVSNRFWSDYQSRYLDVIENNIQDEWAIERLGDARVKYLIVDLSLPEAEDTIFFLDRNKAVKKIHGVEGFVMYEVLNYKPSTVTKHPAMYYFGDISGMKFIPSEITLVNLGIEEHSFELLKAKLVDTLVLYNASQDDLFFTLLTDYKLSFFPEVRFTYNPQTEFYPANANLYSFTQKGIMYYNTEIMNTSGKGRIAKNFTVNPGAYRLLLSTISTEDQSDSLSLTINDKTFKKNNFRTKEQSAEWIDLGTVEIEGTTASVQINNNEETSLFIDHVLLVPIEEYTKLKKEFDTVVQDLKVIDASTTLEDITADRNIHVLSNSYSTYWDICGKLHMRVNFYANGAFCDNEESINPTFTPHKLYQIALYISWLLFGGAIIALLTLYRTSKH